MGLIKRNLQSSEPSLSIVFLAAGFLVIYSAEAQSNDTTTTTTAAVNTTTTTTTPAPTTTDPCGFLNRQQGSAGDSNSTQSNEKTASDDKRIECYSCGMPDIDPELDIPGSYGDAEKDAPDCKKMYNHTCDIADRMGESSRWTRLCPTGVTTCVWATGAYAGQVAKFRGCAPAKFSYDAGCSRELEAVSIIQGKQSVDVEIEVCYTNGEKTNWKRNGEPHSRSKSNLPFIITTLIMVVLSKHLC